MSATAGPVSVIVPHYGDPALALGLLADLTAQEGLDDIEIIVVDDASPEPFPDDARAIVLRRERNGGFGSAVNTAAARASHPLLLILNSDLRVSSRFIADLLDAAAPWQPAVAGPFLVNEAGVSQWAGRHFPRTRQYILEWLTPLARVRSRLHDAVGHDTRCVAGQVVPVDWLVGAVLLVPAAPFRAAGGFDERFHMNCEEVDLQRRLRARGIPSVFAGTVSAVHLGGGSSDARGRLVWLVAARLAYARKWGEGPGRLRAGLVAASLVNAAVNTARRVVGRPVRPLVTLREELGIVNAAARRSG